MNMWLMTTGKNLSYYGINTQYLLMSAKDITQKEYSTKQKHDKIAQVKLNKEIDEVTDTKAVLKSASSSLEFALTAALNPLNENQTEVQMLFEGKFNPFIKMMVEKPLQNFINTLTDKIETYK